LSPYSWVLTDSILGSVVLLGEVIAVTNEKLAAPDVNVGSDYKITISVEFLVDGSSLQSV